MVQLVCQDYGLTPQDLRIAGAVEVMCMRANTADTIDAAATALISVLSDTEMASAIRWGTFVKHARITEQPGNDVGSLLKIRQELDNGSESSQGPDDKTEG